MSNLVTDTVLQCWRGHRRTRPNPSGWISGNAVCCNDRRGRGGLRTTEDGGWVWHCFNCQFKTSWRPGRFITDRNKQFFQKLGITDQQIVEIGFEALRLRENLPLTATPTRSLAAFKPLDLPKGAQLIPHALASDPNNTDLLDVCEYVLARRLALEQYFWTPEESLQRRFIVPFRWQNSTVGWTARAIDANKRPKYLSKTSSTGYVYGLGEQHADNEYILVTEGALDADCISACAVLGNNISSEQRTLIEATSKKIIWVPDRDADGVRLSEQALEFGWQVSVPHWAETCKDINDAVILYGRTAVLVSIIEAATHSRAKTMLRLAYVKNRTVKHG
jgi:hypothetical protein